MASYRKVRCYEMDPNAPIDLTLKRAFWNKGRVVNGEKKPSTTTLSGTDRQTGENVNVQYLPHAAVKELFEGGVIDKEKTSDGYRFNVTREVPIRVVKEKRGRRNFYSACLLDQRDAPNNPDNRSNGNGSAASNGNAVSSDPFTYMNQLRATYGAALNRALSIWKGAGIDFTSEDVRATAYSLFGKCVDRGLLFGQEDDSGGAEEKGDATDAQGSFDDMPEALEEEDDDLPF